MDRLEMIELRLALVRYHIDNAAKFQQYDRLGWFFRRLRMLTYAKQQELTGALN